MAVPPVVRQMIVCQRVTPDPGRPDRVDLLGVSDTLRSKTDPPFPTRYPAFCVFLEVTSCRGAVIGQIQVVEADSGAQMAQTADHQLPLPNDPLETRLFSFRILDCPFPNPGLYWVQFWCDGSLVHEVDLTVRAS